MGMGDVARTRSPLVPIGIGIAVLTSVAAMCAVATGQLVVPTRPHLAARLSSAAVAAGYVVPVLALLGALLLRSRPLLGALGIALAGGAMIFVFTATTWSLALAAPLGLGALLALIGGRDVGGTDAAGTRSR